jgi:peptidoglycan/LPS O-acetylase OafA/YrhL
LGDAALVAGGSVLLAWHCLAMFFTSLAERVPGTDTAIQDIRALGTASLIWYVVPAFVVLAGLRRLHRGALGVAALALLAIGLTMYNGGSLEQHLVAIWVGVVLLAGVLAVLVLPPKIDAGQHRPA